MNEVLECINKIKNNFLVLHISEAMTMKDGYKMELSQKSSVQCYSKFRLNTKGDLFLDCLGF